MRLFSLILSTLLCSLPAPAQQTDGRESNPVVHVATALNHLTVLEFHEPVTLAAAGSSDFQIEREANKVFVKPVKTGAATDLFVWTPSRRFAYELETTEEVKKMTFAIDNGQAETPKETRAVDANQLADGILTSALLAVKDIRQPRSKRPRHQVSVRVEQVFRTRGTVYLHYEITNDSSRPYRVEAPQALQLQVKNSGFSTLILSQLDDSRLEDMGIVEELVLPIAGSESEAQEVGPGKMSQGVLAIHGDLNSPAIVKLVFAEGAKAVVVL